MYSRYEVRPEEDGATEVWHYHTPDKGDWVASFLRHEDAVVYARMKNNGAFYPQM